MGVMSHDKHHDKARKFESAATTKTFMLAGRARVTVVSQKTGVRFTFRVAVRTGDPTSPHFVSLLTGPDNTSSYTFMGTIFDGKVYRTGRSFNKDAPAAKAFAWVWSYVSRGELPPHCEIWHEGCCGKCGKPLTVPSSIAIGLGPDCAAAA
jgi:hypothetical protein